MPFTLSHPAAIVPLANLGRKYGISLSALIVGSMVPDFPYFLRWTAEDRYGHTLPGLFLYCLPVGLLVLAIFHRFVKMPMLSLLPSAHQAKLLPVARAFHWGSVMPFVGIGFAVVLGAITHLVWDSFTHESGWSVLHFPVLRIALMHTRIGTLHLYKLLQHGSSVLGALALVFSYLQWWKTAPVASVDLPMSLTDARKVTVVAAMVVLAIVAAVVYSVSLIPSFVGHDWLHPFLSRFVLAAIALFVLQLLVYSGVWHINTRRQGWR